MQNIIEILKAGNWTQDKIAYSILALLKKNPTFQSDFDIPKVLVDIKHVRDLQKFDKDHVDSSMGIKLVKSKFFEDAIRIHTTCDFSGYYIEDTIYSGTRLEYAYDEIVYKLNKAVPSIRKVLTFKQLAHRDAIQLIPRNRYTGGMLKGVSVRDNLIYSAGHLQPIFASDGIFEELDISDNCVESLSAHSITAGGVLSGTMTGNTDLNGSPILPTLYPARFGGGILNYHIMSFTGRLQYGEVEGASGTSSDLRSINRRGVNIYNLDLDEYQGRYDAMDVNLTRFERVRRVISDLEKVGAIYTRTI